MLCKIAAGVTSAELTCKASANTANTVHAQFWQSGILTSSDRCTECSAGSTTVLKPHRTQQTRRAESGDLQVVCLLTAHTTEHQHIAMNAAIYHL